jgi:hypothetical protein
MIRKIAVLASMLFVTLQTFAQEKRDYRKERAELARQEKEEKKKERTHQAMDYGTNILSITPFSLLDIGVGFGASYEKILGEDKNIGIVLPVNLIFEFNDNYYNGYYTNNGSYNNTYFYFTPGIKIYPFGQRRVTYAIGPNLMLGAGGGKEMRYNEQIGYDEEYNVSKIRVGMLLNNYLTVQFSRSFNLALQAGLGVRYIDRETASSPYSSQQVSNNGMSVTGQFSISLGYRF